MKRFVTNILLFFIGLWLLSLVLDVLISYRFAKSDSFDNVVWNKMIHSEMNNDLLILGSSRAFAHYDPRIIDSVLNVNSYNLGRDGKRIDIQCLTYSIYKKYDNKPPKTILLDFFEASLELSDPYNSAFFYPYIWEKDVWDCVKNTQNMHSIWRFVPLMRYFSQWGFVKKNFHSEYSLYKGYHGFDRPWDGAEFDRIEKIDLAHEDTAIAILNKFLSDCSNDGIDIVLVHSPIYSKYWDKFPDSAAMWNLYRLFANKYDIPLLDYTDDPMCDDTAFFYNARHLNRIGAELFTRKLAHDLDSMGYGNQ